MRKQLKITLISIGITRYIYKSGRDGTAISIRGVYVDDRYSGLNFGRPDFQRMIGDIEDGKINLVITKDLSRFDRDYIQTGYYTEVQQNIKCHISAAKFLAYRMWHLFICP